MTEEQKTPEELIEGMEKAEQPVSSADEKEAFSSTETGQCGSNTVPIVAIVAAAVVCVGCIIACAAVTIAFFQNPPW